MTLDQAFDAGLLIDEAGRPIVSRKQLADAKLVTVHPNGAGSKGTPVQISENGTVLAGMGGKFNGKKLGELKGGSATSLEQSIARQSSEKFTGSWLTKLQGKTNTRTKDPAINTNSSSSEILSTIEHHARSLPTSKQRINARNRMKKSVVESLESDISNVKSQIRVEMSKGARQGELRELYARASVLERKRDDAMSY